MMRNDVFENLADQRCFYWQSICGNCGQGWRAQHACSLVLSEIRGDPSERKIWRSN